MARQNPGDSSGPTALLLMKEERKKQRLSVCTPNPRLRSPLLGNWQGIPVSTVPKPGELESAGPDGQRTMVGTAMVGAASVF